MLYDEWAIPKWTNERADVRKSIRCEIKCVAFDPTPDGHQTSSMCSVSVNQKNIRMPITVSSDKKKCKQREIRIISKSTMCVESCNFIIFVSLFKSRHTIKRIVRFFFYYCISLSCHSNDKIKIQHFIWVRRLFAKKKPYFTKPRTRLSGNFSHYF